MPGENASKIDVAMTAHHERCLVALQRIAMLADTGSTEHKKEFSPYYSSGMSPSGWRIAEAMRIVANDTIGDIPLSPLFDEDIQELQIYKLAMESMAKQLVHPKMTGLEMAKQQLGMK